MTEVNLRKQPFYIFVEGGDGSGKTTTSNMLYNKIKEQTNLVVAKDYIMQSTEIGALLRKIVTTEKLQEELIYSAFTFGVFYGLQSLLKKHIDTDIIIIDRSHGSTYAQTIHANNSSVTNRTAMDVLFTTLNRGFSDNFKDNFIFLHLNADPEKMLHRLFAERKTFDKFEERGTLYQNKISNGYKIFYRKFIEPKKVITFDTFKQTPDEITDQFLEVLRSKGLLKNVN